jgi:DNA-binding MarR family transcriptional regulator/N-acetylglutamate synthase-like GNAT family acetyltransferase
MASVISATLDRTAAVRAFNRSYTRTIGLLQDGLLDTTFSLTEARVLFELGQADTVEVVDLRRSLGLDAGYLSRILSRFESDHLIHRRRSEDDARRQVIMLTEKGRDSYRMIDARSADQTRGLLDTLTEDDQCRLLDAMDVIERLVADDRSVAPIVIRPPEEGDMGWVVERHGSLYAREFGWDGTFEAYVVRVMAEFVDTSDDGRRAAWIADAGGRRVGCIFCTPLDAQVAQLRLFLVEPSARGSGIGTRLVDECVRFARRAGYQRMTLWTYDVLAAARRLYQRAGFTLVSETPEVRFGQELVGQRWELDLGR